jgi:hypothetical protein
LIWKLKSMTLIKVILLCAVAYVGLRMSGLLPISTLETTLSKYFDAERVQSALARMTEEDLFGARARLQPAFGWGGFNRGWPIDPRTGEKLIGMIDALWIILFSANGFFGLLSAFGILVVGPWAIIRAYSRGKAGRAESGAAPSVDGIAICLIVTLFIIDCLQNAMFNPFYILCAGALVSYSKNLKEARTSRAEPAPSLLDGDAAAATALPGAGHIGS